MKIIYLISLFFCTIISIIENFNVKNYLKGYFIFSGTTTLTSFIFTDQIYQDKISNLYDASIVLVSIFGFLIMSKYYSIVIFTGTIILILLSFKFNINIYSNYLLYSLEVLIFIYISYIATQFRKIYNFIFVNTLTVIFLNNYWLKLLYENITVVKSIIKYQTIYYFFGSYLIIFYITFIFYHVKFRTNN